jgi:hypothetical protein
MGGFDDDDFDDSALAWVTQVEVARYTAAVPNSAKTAAPSRQGQQV